MKRYLAFAVVMGALALSGVEGRADTTRLCSQKVDYSIAAPDAAVPAELRAFSGIWTGNVTFSPDATMCVALVVEKIHANGNVDTKFVWLTGSDTGIGNIASLGSVSWSGKIEGDALRLVGSQRGNTYTYEFRPKGKNELGGYFAENAHRNPLKLDRQTAAPL
jgi:hypothetical protein